MMKKTTFASLLSCAMITTGACGLDPQWADPELHEQTLKLREQYTPKLAGQWYRIGEKDTRKFYVSINFKADGTMTAIEKMVRRDTVMVNGQPTLTDWETVMNDTTHTTWNLYINRDTGNGNLIYRMHITNVYDMLFNGIKGDTLHVSGFYGFRYLLRGDVQPDF